MTPNEYQQKAARTTHPDRSPRFGLLISGLGIAGEAGEVADHIKKAIGHEHGVDAEVLRQELGDVLWYVADIATLVGLELEDIMEGNFWKLMGRYPDGFDVERSKGR